MSQPNKRQKLDHESYVDPAKVRQQRAAFLASMNRGISPPRSAKATPEPLSAGQDSPSKQDKGSKPAFTANAISGGAPRPPEINRISSPFKLTTIRDLPKECNIDTVSLRDILGNPLIKEAWVFNFCFDIDWMMQHFDSDVRSTVQVNVIHGSWKKEDGNRMGIVEACERWSNVAAATAYLPDPFGTHHSKMFVLFTHDDLAEVIIHTANMLPKDWTNMTQAVWRSGPLPMTDSSDTVMSDIGTGERFKYDLLEYLKRYKKPAAALVKQLQHADFSSVRGALVASVPAKIDSNVTKSTTSEHLWGHPQLREVTDHIKQVQRHRSSTKPYLVAQVSSIATLPNGWLSNLVNAFNAGQGNGQANAIANFSLIYPTAPNVARSLDGYAAGGSIHTKAQSATHSKQIESLRPYLCQWTKGSSASYSAQRDLAAPHIKTYVQFSQEPTQKALGTGDVSIDWALTTSANLSTQAWGGLPATGAKGKGKQSIDGRQQGIVPIQSFEIGVMVWPELYSVSNVSGVKEMSGSTVDSPATRMVPVFGTDMPATATGRTLYESSERTSDVIGLRMPYDLPLTRYAAQELPWSPGGTYTALDSHGRSYG